MNIKCKMQVDFGLGTVCVSSGHIDGTHVVAISELKEKADIGSVVESALSESSCVFLTFGTKEHAEAVRDALVHGATGEAK